MDVQAGWKWCRKCHSLFAAIPGNPDQGLCPADNGPHDGSTSLPYTAILGDGGPGQQGSWRFCRKCRGMFALQDGAIQGVCPADHQSHDGSTSLRYAALIGEDAFGQQGGWRWCRDCQSMFAVAGTDEGVCTATSSQQGGWRWCQKCQGLFSSDDPSQGTCPAGGSHDGSRSLHYAARFGAGAENQQTGWRWCHKCQGLFSGDDPGHGVCPAGGSHDPGTSLPYVAVIGDGQPGHDGSTSLHYAMLESVMVEWSPSQLPIVSGEVHCDRALVQFASNGNWTFSGHLHDFSSIFGDNFAFGFAFNHTDGAAHGPVITGELGSSLTSVPEDMTFGISGNDAWIAQNWQEAFQGGGEFYLRTSGDVSEALSELGDSILSALGEIFKGMSGNTCPTNPDTGEPECSPPDGGDGGWDGGDAAPAPLAGRTPALMLHPTTTP